MAHYDLKTEQLKEMAPKLRAGDTVTLTGTVYTARDAAHKKIVAAMDAGDKLPFDLDGAAIYYAGPTPAKPGQVIGSVGPTTSGRMDPFAPRLLDAGLACMIGKGVRGQGVQDAMERNGAVYMVAIGGAGAAILAGGRYNALCAKFGKDMPAGGFGIDVESVADSLAGQSRPEVATRRDTVRIALTKGRLEKKTLALLKAAGYDISELEAGTRKLIFTLPDSGVEIVLSKAADVITYVEHGVCDMGVVGKDTIMEKGGSFYEMVDLGFGKCRFALATKKGKDVYGGYKTPVIATKYPAVTKAFFNKKNMDVETIKIEGSVELAPLLELADGIVDIVETGTTLKENGLEVVENVAPISARVIVNLASAKMKKAAIQKVIAELENGLNN